MATEILQSPGATNPSAEEIANAKKSREHKDARWWALDEVHRADVVESLIQRVFRQQIGRFDLYRRYVRMYNNMLGMMWSPALQNKAGGFASDGQKLSLNVIKSVSDTFTAKMTQEQPKCTWLTSGGDWTLQNKAKDAEKFIDGQFYEMGLYDESPGVVLDRCVYGTGAYKVLVDGDLRDEDVAKHAKVCGERTPIFHLAVDNRDGFHGKPRSMFQIKDFDRYQLMALFPDKKGEILDAMAPTDDAENSPFMWQWPNDSISDRVRVNMAWHLRSSPTSDDGWYYVGISNAMLAMVPWPHDYHPFAFYRAMPPLHGFYGIGLAEELRGIQQDINMMIQKAQAAIKLMAVPKWFVPGNSEVRIGHLNNEIDIIRGMTAPTVMVPPNVMPGDFWQHMERQYQRAYELPGVNQMQAMAQKPAGLNSGKAQDTYIDIVSERFSVASRLYQSFILEVGNQVMDRARDITKVYKKYAVLSVSKSTSQSVEFLKVNMEKEQAVLQMYPTNKLARDPAERMAQVEQLVNGGMIDPNDAPRLLEFPDLQQEWNLKYASYELSMQMIDNILNEGVVVQPQPFMNLEETKKWATLKLLRATLAKCPEKNLSLLRTWIVNLDDMIAQAMPPVTAPTQAGLPAGAPPMPGQMPMDPMAGGMPAPDMGMNGAPMPPM